MGSDSLTKDETRRVKKKQFYTVLGVLCVACLGGWVVFTVHGGHTDSGALRELSHQLKASEKAVGQAVLSRGVLEKRVKDLEEQLRATGQTKEKALDALATKEASWVHTGKGKRFAITTAYNGEKYDIMGTLASDTKAKYAAYHGYAYFLDNDILSDSMSFQQKSGSRIAAFRRHWNDYEWLIWTDSDVLLTNPGKKLEAIVDKYAPEDSGIHVLMSKDWGGRQVNPGVTFLKTTPEGKKFLDRWEEEIASAPHHDDLLAIKSGMQPKKAEELKYVGWVPQKELNSYPPDVLRFEAYNGTTVEHSKSHDFWEPGHLFVHVVNCLRQCPGRIDTACCNGIAARYWYEFISRLEKVVQENHRGVIAHDFLDLKKDWTVQFKANLGLK